MKTQSKVVSGAAVLLAVFLAAPVMAQEKKAEKAKAEKVSGDVGLLDTEKNYMIVVTKDGKLVTLDYTQKTKVTELKASNAKMTDIGLGSAASVQNTTKGEKTYLSNVEFTPAKGGD
jgi:major membrane immunogen (membrane-anchored lipoprotein)